MGMYTELHFNAELNIAHGSDVSEILQYMIGDAEKEPAVLPDHALFKTERWRFMLRCDSYYFDADTHSTLRWDAIGDHYYLCIRTNLKNYDSEIEKFIDWIDPYLEKYAGDFLGFYRYEEDEQPTLLYKADTASTDLQLNDPEADTNVTSEAQ